MGDDFVERVYSPNLDRLLGEVYLPIDVYMDSQYISAANDSFDNEGVQLTEQQEDTNHENDIQRGDGIQRDDGLQRDNGLQREISMESNISLSVIENEELGVYFEDLCEQGKELEEKFEQLPKTNIPKQLPEISKQVPKTNLRFPETNLSKQVAQSSRGRQRFESLKARENSLINEELSKTKRRCLPAFFDTSLIPDQELDEDVFNILLMELMSIPTPPMW